MGDILRNGDGSIQFPSLVPPDLEWPPGTVTPGGSLSETARRIAPDQQPAATVDAVTVDRPYVLQQHSDLGPAGAAKLGALKRTGTSIPDVAKHPDGEDDDMSSSSSSDEESPPPPVSRNKSSRDPKQQQRHFRRFHVNNDMFKTKGKVSRKDGRLNISVNEKGNSGYLAKALGASFLKPALNKKHDQNGNEESSLEQSGTVGLPDEIRNAPDELDPPRPRLNIVVMVIGSRGDIQPFLKLGKLLKEEHGHRVRIATHPAFREFVEQDSGLEFFSVGGDPSELMAFMVKNPGMIPKMETLRKGEIGRRRDQMAEMFEGFWRACINASDDEQDPSNRKMMDKRDPFIADAIIANPPCFAHVHCAERLGVPLHLMFTFPYTPTQYFPHPLANIRKTNVDPGYTNFMSYPLVEMMTWQGLGDLVNGFRVKTLGLEPLSTLWAPGQLYRLKVPYTYMWSPGLVPKPKDWGPEINIAGFVFLDLASSFKPPKELEDFLAEGDAPIYIGFGSIVVDDPEKFTEMIFDAVKKAGVRALVSKGWGGLGGDDPPEGIYMLENTPHDWLFPKVKAVCHHGGAGTTAIGLKCGKPTMIVPFFGDQQFWGSMIATKKAGPDPVPYKDLTADKLADGLKQLLTEECQTEADKIAKSIEAEGDGAKNAVKSFHSSLTMRGEHSMRCSIFDEKVAVWSLKGTQVRLSALAAQILVKQRKVNYKDLRLIRHNEWNDFEGPGEPITGGVSALTGSITSMATGLGGVPFKIAKHTKARVKHEEKRKRISVEQQRRSQDVQRQSRNCSMKPTRRTDDKQEQQNIQDIEAIRGKPIDNVKAPAKRDDKATEGTDMGKHTQTGAPADSNTESNEKTAKQQARDAKGEKGKADDAISVLSADPSQNVAAELATDLGTSLGASGEALARLPVDLALAIAQGFHNAPRLYGDSVRRPTRITGFQSGLRAGGEEFVFGVYDGITGVVTQPYRHIRDEGALKGFFRGTAFGLTGLVVKDLAAVFGLIGYPLKGVHKEILKYRHSDSVKFIRAARQRQGLIDVQNRVDPAVGGSKEQQEADIKKVLHGWEVAQLVWRELDEMQRESGGVRGLLRVMRERRTWRIHGAFENVEAAERALDARKRGLNIEQIFNVADSGAGGADGDEGGAEGAAAGAGLGSARGVRAGNGGAERENNKKEKETVGLTPGGGTVKPAVAAPTASKTAAAVAA